MYNKTNEDFKLVFETIDNLPKRNKFRDWNLITETLNEHFGVSLSKKQWRSQYDSAKRREKIFGEPRQRSNFGHKTDVNNHQQLTLDLEEDVCYLKQKLRKYLTKPRNIEQVESYLKVEKVKALGIIQLLKIDNYLISYNQYDQTYLLNKKVPIISKTYNHSIGEVKEYKFLVISDPHWCQRLQQKSFVEFIYDECVRRNIKTVYCVGDISDGYYKGRPEQVYDLFAIGGDEQKDYIVKNWPKRDEITTYFIIGNHDETHIKNGGFNIGKAIAHERPDMVYLGIGHAKVMLTPNCRMDLLHPLDGSSYAVSYSGQKYMDSLSGGDKPNILFVGHHHKVLYFPYRNIHYFEVPSMTKQSSWMKRKRIANESGAWFIKLNVDEEGTIVSILPEHIKQYKYLEEDF